MSTPTGGSWNDDQQGQGAPQGGPGYQGQSLGQGYGQSQGQQQAQPQQPDYGQPAPQQNYGQQPPAHDQQGYGQPGPDQHGGFAGQAQQAGQQWAADATQIASGAGEGLGDLFSDLQFKKSLTEKIAGLTYLVVIVWAVINFLSQLTYNFGSQNFGGTSVDNMSTLSAIVHSVADLAMLIVIVAIVRVLLELAVNVTRIAQRNKD